MLNISGRLYAWSPEQPGIQDLCTPAADYCVVYLSGTRFISMAMYQHSSDEVLHLKQTTLFF
jgi:hypothetical protein